MVRQPARSGVMGELALEERLFPEAYRVNGQIVGRAHAALASPPGFPVHVPVGGDHQCRLRDRPAVLRQCTDPQVFSIHPPNQRRLGKPLAAQLVGVRIVGRKEHGSDHSRSPPDDRFSRPRKNVLWKDFRRHARSQTLGEMMNEFGGQFLSFAEERRSFLLEPAEPHAR